MSERAGVAAVPPPPHPHPQVQEGLRGVGDTHELLKLCFSCFPKAGGQGWGMLGMASVRLSSLKKEA